MSVGECPTLIHGRVSTLPLLSLMIHQNSIFCHVTSLTSSLLHTFNPLECKGNYSATSTNMKLVHWPLMGGLLHWYS